MEHTCLFRLLEEIEFCVEEWLMAEKCDTYVNVSHRVSVQIVAMFITWCETLIHYARISLFFCLCDAFNIHFNEDNNRCNQTICVILFHSLSLSLSADLCVRACVREHWRRWYSICCNHQLNFYLSTTATRNESKQKRSFLTVWSVLFRWFRSLKSLTMHLICGPLLSCSKRSLSILKCTIQSDCMLGFAF